MDAESGDNDKDGLKSGLGGESMLEHTHCWFYDLKLKFNKISDTYFNTCIC